MDDERDAGLGEQETGWHSSSARLSDEPPSSEPPADPQQSNPSNAPPAGSAQCSPPPAGTPTEAADDDRQAAEPTVSTGDPPAPGGGRRGWLLAAVAGAAFGAVMLAGVWALQLRDQAKAGGGGEVVTGPGPASALATATSARAAGRAAVSPVQPRQPARVDRELEVPCPEGELGYEILTVDLGPQRAYSSYRDVTVTGTITNGTTTAIRFGFSGPQVDIGGDLLDIDFQYVSREVDAGETVRWSADGSIWPNAYDTEVTLQLYGFQWEWTDDLVTGCSQLGVAW